MRIGFALNRIRSARVSFFALKTVSWLHLDTRRLALRETCPICNVNVISMRF
jgi:hypothetical protein